MRKRAHPRLLLLTLLCCIFWHASAWAGAPLRLTTAQMLTIPGQGYTPPPYSIDQATLRGTWQSVTLPHALTRDLIPFAQSHNGTGPPTVVTWYRIQVPPLPAANSARYLYIPRWKTDGQLAVYGDQRLLYQSHASVQWNGWNIPLWIALDQSAHAVAPRTLLLRIERPRDSGGGPYALEDFAGFQHPQRPRRAVPGSQRVRATRPEPYQDRVQAASPLRR